MKAFHGKKKKKKKAQNRRHIIVKGILFFLGELAIF
jgi:hypothetical protein